MKRPLALILAVIAFGSTLFAAEAGEGGSGAKSGRLRALAARPSNRLSKKQRRQKAEARAELEARRKRARGLNRNRAFQTRARRALGGPVTFR